MSPLRFRLTIRRLMIVVAIVALASWWLLVRPQRFRRLAEYHRRRASENTTGWAGRVGSGIAYFESTTPAGEWHRRMASKYERAASYPWMPLDSDPLPSKDHPASPRPIRPIPMPQEPRGAIGEGGEAPDLAR